MKKSLLAMVSARPPCRIRCLNTSRLHSNYSTVVSHDTTVFLLTKKFLRPGRGAGQILPLSAALPSSDRFISHLAFCRRSKCCNCCPCGKEGGGDFLHEGEGFGAVAVDADGIADPPIMEQTTPTRMMLSSPPSDTDAAVSVEAASLDAAPPCCALEPQPASRLADIAAATVSARTRLRFFIV